MKKSLLILTLSIILATGCKKDKYNEIIVIKTQIVAKADSEGNLTHFEDLVTFKSNLIPTVEVQGGDALQRENKLEKVQNNVYIYHSCRLPQTKNYILLLKNEEYSFNFKMLWDGLN